MDEMKIGSKFTTGILSKLIAMLIRKKFGYDVELKLNEVNATVIDGKTHVHLDVDAELEKDDMLLIYGAGALGSSILKIAHTICDHIIVADIMDDKLAEAREHGAQFTILSLIHI